MRKRIACAGMVALTAAFVLLAGSATARPLAAPVITAFAPNHGLPGEKVTIWGHNLAGAQVLFNGAQGVNVVVDSTGTHVKVNVPDEIATGPGPITVTTSEGMVVTTTMFTVNPPSKPGTLPKPRISSFAPMSGKAGTRVSIRGANLAGALWVKIGGVKATYTVPAATKIVAIVPKRAHSGTIAVRTGGGLTISSRHFTFSA
jgi:hypothetical protein